MPGVVGMQSTDKDISFGIEVSKGLTWQGWEPGKEYTKNLVLKNVRVKTQKLTYSNPTSRFFSTLYPQPIVLSAGTSFTLPVTFRPLEKHHYEDKIKFISKEGPFEVPIKAVLPGFKTVSPNEIHVKMCAVENMVETTFQIKNESELQTPFQWEVSDPFFIEPSEGVMEPWGNYTIKVSFKPKAAKVYCVDAICKYGTSYSHSTVTKLEGVGKFPHLLVSSTGKKRAELTLDDAQALVSFGDIPIGTTAEKFVEVHNLSPVNAPFKVENAGAQNRIDSVFNLPQKHGIVPAMGFVRIPVIYTPNMVGAVSLDYFNVIAVGNFSKTTIKCQGACKGPKVRLNTNSVNFSQIDANFEATKAVELINDSDVGAVFQFELDCNESVFKFEKLSGSLKPNSHLTVLIKFMPVHPINYYRRVPCLIHNQAPLFLDLLGTCHTELGKPALLQPKHLKRYKTHIERGFSMFPPEHLNELLKSGTLELDDNGALFSKDAEAFEPFCHPVPKVPAMDEYFNDGYHTDLTHIIPHISTDIHQAEFGQCIETGGIFQQTINVTNHTKGKVSVVWMGDSSHVYHVTPATMDIPPLKSTSFRVTFNPTARNQFFGAQLECYAFYKSLRDHKLVEDVTHFPPWCLTVTCSGNTFAPGNETFLPRFTLDSPKLVFPAVNKDEATYRTVLLTNTGTNPILYDFEKDNSGIFSVKPSKGLLGQGSQVFTVKCVPNAVKVFKNVMKVFLNEAEKNTQELKLFGSAEVANVFLENEATIYFKPTCIGTDTERLYHVKNISRVPIRFEWHTKHADAKFISVSPKTGMIMPNESQPHTWTFTPNSHDKVVLKPSLVVWGQGINCQSSAGKKRSFPIRAIGEGTTGDIIAQETYVDFGNVIVGSSESRYFTICNNSNCNLNYRLHVSQNIEGPYLDEQVRGDACVLSLDEMEGVLPARSRHMINATVRPMRRSYYQFTISFEILTPKGDQATSAEPQHLCHMLATGVFPTLTVTDTRCYGSAIGISKKHLWNLFSVDRLNSCLDSDPSPAELMYSAVTRQSHQRRPPVYTRDILDFNFSAAPLNSQSCVMKVQFENTGSVPTSWGFYFPCDLQIELEYWADSGEYDPDELHEMKVMDNELFDVQPREGRLEPGQSMTVVLEYRHKMPGTDRLPVLLKLDRGREILLNFIGVTVEPERPYIHFPSNRHRFTPVPIGEKTSPKQIYEMYNGGAIALTYKIDTVPLAIMQRENFDHPIFSIVNPTGEILPGRSASIEWCFSPLEARTYTVDVPIHIANGDTALVTFTGIGYDKRNMGDTLPMTDQLESDVPVTQSVAVPGQLAFLSIERVSIGNLPLFARGRRVLYITNRSLDHRISFVWHVTSRIDSQFVNIHPQKGVLLSGHSAQCKVSFTAVGDPSFYDLDLICEVTDETLMDVYKYDLAKWNDEKGRQNVEFNITEKSPNDDMRIVDPHVEHRMTTEKPGSSSSAVYRTEERPPSGRLRTLDSIQKQMLDGDMPKYRTLPPIKKLSEDEKKVLEKEAKKIQDAFWEKPLPPKPFLLHLGVTARTHDITEFQINFPEQCQYYHIDRCLSNKSSAVKKSEPIKEDEQIQCIASEADVVEGTMANLLRGLMDDLDFIGALKDIKNDPIPLFTQVRQVDPEPSISQGGSSRLPTTSRLPTRPESPDIPIQSPEIEAGPESPEREAGGDGTPSSVVSPSLIEEDEEPELAILRATGLGDTPPPTKATTTPTNKSDEKKSLAEEQLKIKENEIIRRLPEFGNIIETMVENTLTNILSEAASMEFNITARPRLIALPSRPNSSSRLSNKS